MIQIIGHDAFVGNAALHEHIVRSFKLGKHHIGQLVNNSASLGTLTAMKCSADGSKTHDVHTSNVDTERIIAPYTAVFSHSDQTTEWREASMFLSYPLFYVELCGRDTNKEFCVCKEEYMLRLGPMEPVCVLWGPVVEHSSITTHNALSSHFASYYQLNSHTLLVPLYFAHTSTVALEVYAQGPSDSNGQELVFYSVSTEEFIQQAERTYTVPLNSTLELRITYCGSYQLSRLFDLTKLSLEFPLPRGKDVLPILGHRGCGSNKVHSQRKVPIAENTPLSMLTAQNMGYAGGELDVILTCDSMLVINHDFEFTIAVDGQLKVSLPIPFTTYDALVAQTSARKIRIQHGKKTPKFNDRSTMRRSSTTTTAPYRQSLGRSNLENECAEEENSTRVLLQLEKAAGLTASTEKLDAANYSLISDDKCVYTLGEMLSRCSGMLLDIELKYPSKASQYYANYTSRIKLVQRTLATLSEACQPKLKGKNKAKRCTDTGVDNGGSNANGSGCALATESSSPSFFISSFDPLVCIICRLQAPDVPVFLLFMGDNKTIEHHTDVDLTSYNQLCSASAVSLAAAMQLSGMVLWREVLDIQTASVTLWEYALSKGLTLLTYGTSIGEDMAEQKKKGISALICDLCHHDHPNKQEDAVEYPTVRLCKAN